MAALAMTLSCLMKLTLFLPVGTVMIRSSILECPISLTDSPDGLKRIARQAGLGEKEFQACLADGSMLKAIKQTREDAVAKLRVKSTPTFFINGARLEGATAFEEFEKLITPQLKSNARTDRSFNSVVEPHDLTHALDGVGRRIVHALHAAAKRATTATANTPRKITAVAPFDFSRK